MEKSFNFTDNNNLSRKFPYLGVFSSILSYIGFINDSDHFYHSYLVSFVFWMTLSGGCMFFVMMHSLKSVSNWFFCDGPSGFKAY